MLKSMTFLTNRNNIEPMFRFIAFVMVIKLCLRGAVMALKGIGSGQFAACNSIIHSVFCLAPFKMANGVIELSISNCNFVFIGLPMAFSSGFTLSCFLIFPLPFAIYSLTFLCLSVTFIYFMFYCFTFLCLSVAFICFTIYCLAFICLMIFSGVFQLAYFAFILITILITGCFIKSRKVLSFFANTAGFCYGFSSHFRLLNRRFWLEPIAEPISVLGSLYFISNQAKQQIKLCK